MPKKAAAPKVMAAAVTPDPAALALEVLGLCVWKMRHHLPALVIQIGQADRNALQDTLNYNEQTLKVNIEDRLGTTLVHLTDAKTGDQIIANENNEADLNRAQASANLRQIRQTVPDLANQVLNAARMGDMSLSLIEELCAGAVALARAQQ